MIEYKNEGKIVELLSEMLVKQDRFESVLDKLVSSVKAGKDFEMLADEILMN